MKVEALGQMVISNQWGTWKQSNWERAHNVLKALISLARPSRLSTLGVLRPKSCIGTKGILTKNLTLKATLILLYYHYARIDPNGLPGSPQDLHSPYVCSFGCIKSTPQKNEYHSVWGEGASNCGQRYWFKSWPLGRYCLACFQSVLRPMEINWTYTWR